MVTGGVTCQDLGCFSALGINRKFGPAARTSGDSQGNVSCCAKKKHNLSMFHNLGKLQGPSDPKLRLSKFPYIKSEKCARSLRSRKRGVAV